MYTIRIDEKEVIRVVTESPGERTRAVRIRRRTDGERKLRLIPPDDCAEEVRARIAKAVARLDRSHGEDSLRWTETVSELDEADSGAQTQSRHPGFEPGG